MAPSAIDDAPMASGRNSPKPAPARLYTVNEPPFEGFKPVDSEGYARSNHETAIVIDNGTHIIVLGFKCNIANTPQARQQSEQDGPSIPYPEYQYCPTWRDTEIESLTGLSPSSVRMSTPMAQHEDNRSRYTSQAAT